MEDRAIRSDPRLIELYAELRRQQDELAKRETNQRKALNRTRSQLDEVTSELDAYIATPERVERAVALARGEIVDPPRSPEQPVGYRPTLEQFLKAYRRAKGQEI